LTQSPHETHFERSSFSEFVVRSIAGERAAKERVKSGREVKHLASM
jgi:hypothetical protein